jgi:phosphoribosylanthranilate isomerase
VAFQVIPGIDVAGGRLVRLSSRGPVGVDAFGGDPVSAARAFIDAGAAILHVVDVDQALSGRPSNLEVVAAVVAAGATVQASGGIRTRAHVEASRDAGAARVVLGSACLADRELTEALVREGGDAVVIGIEADGTDIVPRGEPDVRLAMWETLMWLRELPVARYLLTEVARAGGLTGPDLDGPWALATSTGRPVIAAGGVRGVDDLRSLARLGGTVEGAVVGRALYEGLDLREALAAVA